MHCVAVPTLVLMGSFSDPAQVNIWFGNQRQRDARARSEASDAFVKPPYIVCGSGRVRLRSSALLYFSESQWSDELLREIVLIEHFRRRILLDKGNGRSMSPRTTSPVL